MATADIFTPPDSYTVGGKETSPFVTTLQVKGHLALLNEFVTLNRRVNSLTPDDLERYKSLPNGTDHVASSAAQFEAWCSSLTEEDVNSFDEESLPPIDVLMVWHSYMLNPGNYSEDCLRVPICKYLRPLSPLFTKILPKLPDVLDHTVSSSRKDNWDDSCSDWPFDPLISAKEVQYKKFRCPAPGCLNIISHEYVREDGMGFLQQYFSSQCSSCNFTVDRQALVLRRLLDDIYRETPDVSQYLAGSLMTMQNTCDHGRGERIKSMLKDVLRKQNHNQISEIESVPVASVLSLKNLDLVVNWVNQPFRRKPEVLKMLNHVLDSYRCPKPFSTDLVAAVLRQFDFAMKIGSLPWGTKMKTPEDERPLIHAIARYHSFLDLMSSRLGFHVPTLDIDLAWHTHQLSGVDYERDCFGYVGKFVNHDDKVDIFQLGDGFNDTCRAWQNRYGIRYAYCGCPIPNTNSVGQRLSRVLSKSSTSTSRHLTDHSPPITEASADCTHPSIHSTGASLLKPDEYIRKNQRMSQDMDKQNRTEKKEAGKWLNATLTQDDMMTQVSSTKWSNGHRTFLQEVPLYVETPVVGCRSSVQYKPFPRATSEWSSPSMPPGSFSRTEFSTPIGGSGTDAENDAGGDSGDGSYNRNCCGGCGG
ncbi:hypothetical protein DL96DRAFT_1822810 [Flagelloscypha sp. PMI_526]|nr:hypothetical protein DL96DRAFT_1822810 [Flagelloscypha sp. PMI_526]